MYTDCFWRKKTKETNALRGGNKRKSKYKERKLEAERSETMKLWPASVILDDNERVLCWMFFPSLSNTGSQNFTVYYIRKNS